MVRRCTIRKRCKSCWCCWSTSHARTAASEAIALGTIAWYCVAHKRPYGLVAPLAHIARTDGCAAGDDVEHNGAALLRSQEMPSHFVRTDVCVVSDRAGRDFMALHRT